MPAKQTKTQHPKGFGFFLFEVKGAHLSLRCMISKQQKIRSAENNHNFHKFTLAFTQVSFFLHPRRVEDFSFSEVHWY